MNEVHIPSDGYQRGRQHVRDGIGRDFNTAEYFRVQSLKNMAGRYNINESSQSYREYLMGMYDEATRQETAV